MKVYEIREFGIENLEVAEREIPKAAADEVLVKFHAASLNYRDLMMVNGWYKPNLKFPLVPLSDGAGEVIDVGSAVTRWKIGDRVTPIFMQGWLEGAVTREKARTALGGDLDGCLREFGTFNENGLVRIPEHLTYEEASTLPCAAVTAWNALKECFDVKEGDTLLTLGTGGVSIFSLQFAKNLDADVIITSSSNQKLELAQTLGARYFINYAAVPDWDKEVLEITKNVGADYVVEVGGAGTIRSSLNSVKYGGKIAVIGVLSGKGEIDPISILMKAAQLQGIFVGSRKMFEEMNVFLGKHFIKPVVNRVFGFTEAKDALRYMESGAHFGKIVISF
ncbi:MAG: zinc-dependent alcohol dehydrogenase family protein [Pyrinomonadaceae bacterium]